jgi:hypothetical protein
MLQLLQQRKMFGKALLAEVVQTTLVATALWVPWSDQQHVHLTHVSEGMVHLLDLLVAIRLRVRVQVEAEHQHGL